MAILLGRIRVGESVENQLAPQILRRFFRTISAGNEIGVALGYGRQGDGDLLLAAVEEAADLAHPASARVAARTNGEIFLWGLVFLFADNLGATLSVKAGKRSRSGNDYGDPDGGLGRNNRSNFYNHR